MRNKQLSAWYLSWNSFFFYDDAMKLVLLAIDSTRPLVSSFTIVLLFDASATSNAPLGHGFSRDEESNQFTST
jgi:hypothetical protein